MKLSFLGAAGTVTGSRYLIEHAGHRVLVDCGLFQGYKNLRLMNWEAPPFEPSSLDAVVLTHAHLDHSGALPRLVRQGYRGRILATPATRELCELMLPDSARLQEEEASFHNRHGSSKHRPALPLYSEDDARAALERFEALRFGHVREVAPGLSVTLRPAGHILGAASVLVQNDRTSVLFSGDVGRPDDPIQLPPQTPPVFDHLVLESTYGDREHADEDVLAQLQDVISRTVGRGGTVVIPAFAVGRAQALLLMLARLRAAGSIPDVPVFLNSPMAIDMTDLYLRHRESQRLMPAEWTAMAHIARNIRSVEDSKLLGMRRQPCVIVSASGMATGGRVLHHLRVLAPDPRNAIVFAGFQAAGTRGARLVGGEKSIRIFGETVQVNAEVVNLRGLSAHADAAQIVDWLKGAPQAPQSVWLTHGEPGPADALRQRLESALGWPATVARHGQTVELKQGVGA
jgi:metallo-beta-lactamase family protein